MFCSCGGQTVETVYLFCSHGGGQTVGLWTSSIVMVVDGLYNCGPVL